MMKASCFRVIFIYVICLFSLSIVADDDIFELINKDNIPTFEGNLLVYREKTLSLKTSKGIPILFYSIFKSKFDIVNLLLAYGADPNQAFTGYGLLPIETDDPNEPMPRIKNTSYPLSTIVMGSDELDDNLDAKLETIKKLLEKGADINLVNTIEDKPVTPSVWHYAATTGNISILKLLLKYTPDVNFTNKKDWYPCVYAVLYRTDKWRNTKYDRPLAFLLLLKHGAFFDPHKVMDDGKVFLDLEHNKEIKKLYEKQGTLDEKIKEIEALRDEKMKEIREPSPRRLFKNTFSG